MSTPFLNDALVRSVVTRKIAALETSTRRGRSQKQVSQLNDLVGAYHGIVSTPNMKPETAMEVLSDAAQDKNLFLQNALLRQQQYISTLSNVMKQQHDTAASIIANLKG